MIHNDIIKDLQENPSENDEFKIDVQACLNTLEKIEQGDFSGFTEITDIDAHIQSLKKERKAGILQGILSNSFFEPLPEEELNAWK